MAREITKQLKVSPNELLFICPNCKTLLVQKINQYDAMPKILTVSRERCPECDHAL